MDVTSFDASPTTLENLNVRMRSMPSTEPWPSGKPKEYENLFRFEHPGCWPQTGLVISDSFSPPTSTAPNTTILLYRLHPLVLYLQSSPRSWTVCATTKKQLQSGLTARTQNVPAWPSDNMQPLLINLINTWFSMETAYTSPMHPLHPLLRVHFRTKSSHPPRKYIHPFARLCSHGLPGTHSLHYQKHTLMNSGNGPSTPITPRSTTTSRTRTSHASNSSSRRPSFTMKTNELHPCGSTARWSISSASPRPSPTH